MNAKFYWENIKGMRDHLKDQGITRLIMLKWVLGEIEYERVDWINWIRTESNGGYL
jgi:hypothetical protein